MRIDLSALCALLTATIGGSAFAGKPPTEANRVAKAAFAAKSKGKIDHAHEVYSFDNGKKEFVMGWNGATTGPGAKGAYMMVVPTGKDSASMVRETKISKNLAGEGKALVRAHLNAEGLSGRIDLGDHMAKQATNFDHPRLRQHPFTRDSGFLRYTVTPKSGEQKRYLVPTNPGALVSGKGKLLGKVQLDTDRYGQKPLRPVAQ
jgi:hypothetical protein